MHSWVQGFCYKLLETGCSIGSLASRFFPKLLAREHPYLPDIGALQGSRAQGALWLREDERSLLLVSGVSGVRPPQQFRFCGFKVQGLGFRV